MPTISVEGPVIDNIEKKRKFVSRLTDAMEEYYGLPRSAYVVLIRENKPENVSVGGTLVIDRRSDE